VRVTSHRTADLSGAAEDINYRRFFDVNDLAALRVDNEEVFEARPYGLDFRCGDATARSRTGEAL
jgi:hypothetical protein